MESIVKIQNSGVAVFGYYEKDMRFYFTCINQDANTPQHLFELDFDTDYMKGIVLIRESNGNRVFIPIVNQKQL